MDNPLDFLAGESPVEPTPVGETPTPAPDSAPAVVEAVEGAAAPVEAPEGPARGPDGKFIAATETQSAAPAPIAPPATPEAGHVPIAAVLDEREKRQKAERENEDLRAQLSAQNPQAEQPQIDEEVQRQIYLNTLNTRLDISEDIAREKHGDELIDKVKTWAQEKMAQSPELTQAILSNRNPYQKAVQEYERDQLVSTLTPDVLAQFKEWQAAQANPKPPEVQTADPAPLAAPTAAPIIPAPPPPRSIAAAPSAGGTQHVPTGPGQGYDALFAKG